MEVFAVIIGYLLGIAPFVTPKIIQIIKNRNKNYKENEENKEKQEIYDEWLNGPKENNINQQDIYNEYITGKESNKKGE